MKQTLLTSGQTRKTLPTLEVAGKMMKQAVEIYNKQKYKRYEKTVI